MPRSIVADCLASRRPIVSATSSTLPHARCSASWSLHATTRRADQEIGVKCGSDARTSGAKALPVNVGLILLVSDKTAGHPVSATILEAISPIWSAI